MINPDYRKLQIELCRLQNSPFFSSDPETIIGVSINAIESKMPMNGLRHTPSGKTNGWYIWGGIELSSDIDFFKPYHQSHIYLKIPIISKYLGLAPGWRFIMDNSYEDIWYDKSIVNP